MDKIKAAEKLKEKGYDASGSEGLVIVRYLPGTYEETRKNVCAILKEIKYNASWGLISKKKSKPAETIEVDAETESNIVNTEEVSAKTETVLPDEGEQMSFGLT